MKFPLQKPTQVDSMSPGGRPPGRCAFAYVSEVGPMLSAACWQPRRLPVLSGRVICASRVPSRRKSPAFNRNAPQQSPSIPLTATLGKNSETKTVSSTLVWQLKYALLIIKYNSLTVILLNVMLAMFFCAHMLMELFKCDSVTETADLSPFRRK